MHMKHCCRRGAGGAHLAALSCGSDSPTRGIPVGAGMTRIPSCHACARGNKWTRPLNCHQADCGLVPSGMSCQKGNSSTSWGLSLMLPSPSSSITGTRIVVCGAAGVVYDLLHSMHAYITTGPACLALTAHVLNRRHTLFACTILCYPLPSLTGSSPAPLTECGPLGSSIW
jgi:hypothetical protein